MMKLIRLKSKMSDDYILNIIQKRKGENFLGVFRCARCGTVHQMGCKYKGKKGREYKICFDCQFEAKKHLIDSAKNSDRHFSKVIYTPMGNKR